MKQKSPPQSSFTLGHYVAGTGFHVKQKNNCLLEKDCFFIGKRLSSVNRFFLLEKMVETKPLCFDKIDIDISTDEVLVQLGYPARDSASAKFLRCLEAEFDKAIGLIEAKGVYLLVDAAETGLEAFADAGQMVLALATVGSAIETRARGLIDEQLPATGLIADAIGTIAAEKTADFIESRIRHDFSGKGYKISRRFAPGYCQWDIRNQKALLGCFPDTLGIELTESCLMIPEKSLSFLCLISSSGDLDRVKVGDCKLCDTSQCSHRQHRYGDDPQRK